MDKLDFCDQCVLGKQKKVSFSIATHRTKGTLIIFILICEVLLEFLLLEENVIC